LAVDALTAEGSVDAVLAELLFEEMVSKCNRTHISYLPGITMDPLIVFTNKYKSVVEEIVEIVAGEDAAKHWFGGAAIDIDWDTMDFRNNDTS